MMLFDSKGNVYEVKPGLVDKQGLFLLLMDDNYTKHYQFSDEADLIQNLLDEIDALKAERRKLHKQIDKLAYKNETLLETIRNIHERFQIECDEEC